MSLWFLSIEHHSIEKLYGFGLAQIKPCTRCRVESGLCHGIMHYFFIFHDTQIRVFWSEKHFKEWMLMDSLYLTISLMFKPAVLTLKHILIHPVILICHWQFSFQTQRVWWTLHVSVRPILMRLVYPVESKFIMEYICMLCGTRGHVAHWNFWLSIMLIVSSCCIRWNLNF